MLEYLKVPSILGPLLLLIYINDLTEGLSSNVKLFADDMSLFSVIRDIQTSANNFNKDLERISGLLKGKWTLIQILSSSRSRF